MPRSLPSGLDLEKTGFQRSFGRSYPRLVPIIPDLKHKRATLRLMKELRSEKVHKRIRFSTTNVRLRFNQHKLMLTELAKIYKVKVKNGQILKINKSHISQRSWMSKMSSGSSNYNPRSHTITLTGKFSMITSLHEFGHARGFDEVDAVIWSTNLFKRIFPKSFEKLGEHGHTLSTVKKSKKY